MSWDKNWRLEANRIYRDKSDAALIDRAKQAAAELAKGGAVVDRELVALLYVLADRHQHLLDDEIRVAFERQPAPQMTERVMRVLALEELRLSLDAHAGRLLNLGGDRDVATRLCRMASLARSLADHTAGRSELDPDDMWAAAAAVGIDLPIRLTEPPPARKRPKNPSDVFDEMRATVAERDRLAAADTFAGELRRIAVLCYRRDWVPLVGHDLPDAAWNEVAQLLEKAAEQIEAAPKPAAKARPGFIHVRPGGTAERAKGRSGQLVCPRFQLPGPYEWIRVRGLENDVPRQGEHYLVEAGEPPNSWLRCNCGLHFSANNANVMKVD